MDIHVHVCWPVGKRAQDLWSLRRVAVHRYSGLRVSRCVEGRALRASPGSCCAAKSCAGAAWGATGSHTSLELLQLSAGWRARRGSRVACTSGEGLSRALPLANGARSRACCRLRSCQRCLEGGWLARLAHVPGRVMLILVSPSM